MGSRVIESSSDEGAQQLKSMMKTLTEEVRLLGKAGSTAKSTPSRTSQSDRESGGSWGAESLSEDESAEQTPRVKQFHVDRMIARLHEFEKGIAMDRAAGVGSSTSAGSAIAGGAPPGFLDPLPTSSARSLGPHQERWSQLHLRLP